MNTYAVALGAARQAWGAWGLGAPPDSAVEAVQDMLLDVRLKPTPLHSPRAYMGTVAKNTALRLARKEARRAARLAELQTEVQRLQATVPSLDVVVDARIRLTDVAHRAKTLPPTDKAVIVRLLDGTTTTADRNDVRRIRRALEG